MRIVSCVPSISELVAFFDSSQLLGRTKFCTEPLSISGVSTIGGTRNLNSDIIRSLKPDIILAVREENQKDQIEQLMEEFNVIVFEIESVSDALQMIITVGRLMERDDLAKCLIREIQDGFRKLDFNVKIPVLYLIWDSPVMTVGGDTFIHNMLSRAGFRNVFEHRKRYPVVDLETYIEEEPQIILLSSEPYPFQEKHLERFQKRFPHSSVVLADGSFFSWYGNRMTQFPDYVLNIRHLNGF
jgi:ABC-type Fe3+-hydroxamate transport system substrate-binding protein